MFEYLEQAQSALRRINSRMVTLAKNLGSDSDIVNNLASKMDVLLGSNLRYKDNVPQLFKPSEIFADPDKLKALQNIDETIVTWGDLRKAYEKPYEAYKEESAFFKEKPIPIGSFVQKMENLPEAIREIDTKGNRPKNDAQAKAIALLKEKGRKKTYSELFTVLRSVK